MGRVVLERNERAEPISRSQVVKLKVCDPTISEAGRPTAGRPLMCLGEGDGRRGRHARRRTGVTADCFPLSVRPHMFQFSRRKVPTQNGSVESCRDGSVLFLLLGLLVVDLLLCLRLFWVAFVLI